MLVALLFSTTMMLDPSAAAAQPAPSATGAPVQMATAAKPAKVDSERICKMEPVLGSKITKKVCYSRSQMEERTFYDKQNLDRIQTATPAPR